MVLKRKPKTVGFGWGWEKQMRFTKDYGEEKEGATQNSYISNKKFFTYFFHKNCDIR